MHVLAPDELQPPSDLLGEWRLLDSEPMRRRSRRPSRPAVLRTYRRLLDSFCQEASDFCRRRGMTYVRLRSDVHLQDVLMRTFRTAGILV